VCVRRDRERDQQGAGQATIPSGGVVVRHMIATLQGAGLTRSVNTTVRPVMLCRICT
jgi:hypothetical protein